MNYYIILHHSATPKENTSLEAIRKDHKKRYGRTFYQIMIDEDGKVYDEHKEWNYRGKNKRSVDICLIGNFTNEVPNVVQLCALNLQLKNIYEKFNIVGDFKVLPHSELISSGLSGTNSSCPGNLLQYYTAHTKN